MKYLYNSHYKAGNEKPIYRLNKKLTPTQWKQISKYFKYYNIGKLHGWGTIHPHEVIKILHEKELKKFDEKIEKAKKNLAWSMDSLEAFHMQRELTKCRNDKRQYISTLI